MARNIDRDTAVHGDHEPRAPGNRLGSAGRDEGRPRVLVVDDDRLVCDLIAEWLAQVGCEVATTHLDEVDGSHVYDVIIADVPFPRRGGADALRRIAARHPTSPVLALSSAFFDRIDDAGSVARSIGAARVLAKPLRREALIAAVVGLLHDSGAGRAA